MEALFPLFVLFVIVASLVSKAKKTTEQQTRQTTHRTADKPQPAQGAERLHRSTLTAMERPDARTQPAQPRIHARVDEPYVGSLGVASTEGYGSAEGTDPCHDAELDAQRHAYAVHDESALRPTLNVLPDLGSRQALVQAIVVSEVLARPGARRRG